MKGREGRREREMDRSIDIERGRERDFIGADPNVDHSPSTINSGALKQVEESE